jgi:hypothetical protein
MKNVFTFAFALAIMCTCSVGNLHAQFSGGGTGTAANPFKIKTADDLNNVRNYIGSGNADKHFRLMNDIDLTAFLQGYTDGWIPVGENNNRFTGYFHGGGYKVKELWINRPALDYVGLFGTNSGTIDSLEVSVSDKNITGQNYVAGLVGYNYGTIKWSSATGSTIFGKSQYCGGLIGYNTGTVTNSYATGSSYSSYSYSYSSYSGGLIGYNTGTVTNSYATGSSSSSSSSYYYSYSYSGGLVGYLEGGKVSNCYTLGKEITGNNYKGAFVGYCNNANYLSQCYYNSDLAGTLSGVGNGTGSNNVLGVNTVGMKLKATYGNWDFYTTWLIEDGVSYPYLYENPPADQSVVRGEGMVCVNSLQTYTAEKGKTNYVWTVTNGVISSGQSTNQIVVKWNNNINNGKVSVSYNNGAQTSSRYIQLLPLPQPSISGEMQGYVGKTLAYETETGMSDYTWTVTGGEIVWGQSTNKINVLWKSAAGHVKVNYANQNGCYADVATDSLVAIVQLFAGGIGTVANPYIIKTAEHLANIHLFPGAHYNLANDIDLSDYLKNSAAGWEPIPDFSGSFDGRYFKIKGLWINQPNSDNLGLFASNRGTISRLYVEIDSKGIYGNNYMGGLVAKNAGSISQCAVANGNINAKGNYVGGLVGYNGNISNVGITDIIIVESYSSNTVVWGNEYVGGLVGASAHAMAKVHQCYAVNTVVGSQYTGGLIGMMDGATCSQSYSAGAVEGGNFIGGLLGYNGNGIITGCYYDQDTSGQYDGLGNPDDSQAGNIKAKYTSDMMKQKTFLAWDFANVWKINELESYPYFRWQDNVPVPPVQSISAPEQSLRIYPNPTGGIVTIDCQAGSTIKVYTLSGQIVLQSTAQSGKETINLTDYPKGIYLVQVDNWMRKVIKK